VIEDDRGEGFGGDDGGREEVIGHGADAARGARVSAGIVEDDVGFECLVGLGDVVAALASPPQAPVKAVLADEWVEAEHAGIVGPEVGRFHVACADAAESAALGEREVQLQRTACGIGDGDRERIKSAGHDGAVKTPVHVIDVDVLSHRPRSKTRRG
jgi:hypothetical protein